MSRLKNFLRHSAQEVIIYFANDLTLKQVWKQREN